MIYTTNKSDVYHFDDLWSSYILDLKNYSLENNKSYRYVLVVIDIFSKFGWTIVSENNNDQTIKNSIDFILISSIRKINLIELDRGKEFYKNVFR